MFINYIKIAFRNLLRYKGYSLVNILGLAVGLAACVIILSYVQFEQSFDRYNRNADRIHRLETIVSNTTGEETWAVNSRNIAGFMKETFPEIEQVVRLSGKDEPLVKTDQNRYFESAFRFGDPSLFELFDVELLQGAAISLKRPKTIMLSHSVAEKIFSDEEPIGKILEVSDQWDESPTSFEVVGVFSDLPLNSQFSMNMLASMATVDEAYTDMNRQTCQTFFMLRQEASIDVLNAKIARLDLSAALGERYKRMSLQTIPLTSVHLYSEADARTELELQGDIRLVYLFSLIALLIIAIACINYMNLATARAAERSREVGVRKVVGAERQQLIFQFFGESMVFVVLSMIIGLMLAHISLPAFQSLLNQSFTLDWKDPGFLSSVVLGAIVVGFIAGSYPALLLSGFLPSQVLKGTYSARTWPLVRKSLVVFQFTVSIGFIAATFIIYQQLNYATSQRLGFKQDQRLVLMTRSKLGDNAGAFKEALRKQAGVKQVSMTSGIPGHGSGISFISTKDVEGLEDQEEEFIFFDLIWVDHAFYETYGITLHQGRWFSKDLLTDGERAVLLNETAVKKLGWEDPLGKMIKRNGIDRVVIGVVKDFHLKNLKEEIVPLLIDLDDYSTFVTLNLEVTNLQASLVSFEQVWDTFIPDSPFQYAFLEDEIEAMYREERRLGFLFTVFSSLAVFVACLGLFGLATYTSIQRKKEIGIRKILGASTTLLVRLLSEEYLKLVVFAFIIATPAVYLSMRNWLDTFAYRIELSWWIFAGAGAVAILIAVFAVSYQSLKAALSNPVDALRYE